MNIMKWSGVSYLFTFLYILNYLVYPFLIQKQILCIFLSGFGCKFIVLFSYHSVCIKQCIKNNNQGEFFSTDSINMNSTKRDGVNVDLFSLVLLDVMCCNVYRCIDSMVYPSLIRWLISNSFMLFSYELLVRNSLSIK